MRRLKQMQIPSVETTACISTQTSWEFGVTALGHSGASGAAKNPPLPNPCHKAPSSGGKELLTATQKALWFRSPRIASQKWPKTHL